MTTGELGVPKPGDDNPRGAPHNKDVDPQVGKKLLEHLADAPPNPLQGYFAEQVNLANEADRLRGLLHNPPAEFAQSVLSFLELEINLGNIARSTRNQQWPQDVMTNFSSQDGLGQRAASMKQTLETEGADNALKKPEVSQGVAALLQQADWVVGRR
jgi:hypothetical protein